MEHRGVGLSRTDQNGTDLPRGAITVAEVIDDAAAILDAEGVKQVIVYGASYGSYLAQGFGIRYPERVGGMILDSAMMSAGFDLAATDMLKALFWDGTPATQHQTETIRRLIEQGTVDAEEMFALQFLYELGGAALGGPHAWSPRSRQRTTSLEVAQQIGNTRDHDTNAICDGVRSRR
ncbi:alpha/beta hydrolase (plasmid) [Arthrobacter sp. Z1-15]